jgi:hypothetical protein
VVPVLLAVVLALAVAAGNGIVGGYPFTFVP